MEEQGKKTLFRKIMAEYRWEKYAFYLSGLGCFIFAWETNESFSGFIRDGALHTALLLACLGYLSELRYTLIPESRGN